MLEIEIDGKKLKVPSGSTVMEAAHQVGTYIPHFCYHKKLSIAANCRMCLVEVEKAPKPLPACATPVTDGMKVFTHSDLASKAQKGVMEFLLINHPLDCPICDQGGECQLQDLAVGYGNTASRYQEEKRSVVGKEMSALVSAEEMSRCIHCTRCVRFTEEIGGYQEIGMAHRGEHSEILPFLNKTVDSEISGNVIDLCPVGALTSKPFRYSARTWEMSRRKSVSPHDGLGSNLVVQVKHNRVMRVLPLENEEINECWLSDRDRFSYESLNSDSRLTRPMVKQDGRWIETEWAAALDYVAHGLKDIVAKDGADQVAFLASPGSTTEELALFKQLANGLGVKNTDYRTRRSDFRADPAQQGALWLGDSIVGVANRASVLLLGSNLRKEQPLLASRLRQSVKKGMELNVLSMAADDFLCALNSLQLVHPDQFVASLAQVLKGACELKGVESAINLEGVEVSDLARRVAISLTGNENPAILIGAQAQHHPKFSEILSLAQALATVCSGTFGVIAEAANTVAGELFFRPEKGALNASSVFESPRQAYVFLNTELDFDTYNPSKARSAVKNAKMVAALTVFKTPELLEYADVLLPVAPFSETAGSFINMEGRFQAFNGVVKPLGDVRPAWKVLRVLGNVLNLEGFDYETVEDVRRSLVGHVDFSSKLSNAVAMPDRFECLIQPQGFALSRIAEVPLYQFDALSRHAESLQKTSDAKAPIAMVNTSVMAAFGLSEGDLVVVSQSGVEASLVIGLDNTLPDAVVRLAAAHPLTCSLGGMYDKIELKRG